MERIGEAYVNQWSLKQRKRIYGVGAYMFVPPGLIFIEGTRIATPRNGSLPDNTGFSSPDYRSYCERPSPTTISGVSP